MSKTTIIAIFMVILVLGLVPKGTQGQELCHEYINGAVACEAQLCRELCTWRHPGGNGACMPSSKQCVCSFSCNA
ncbi:hypothetical protein CARUB_v10019561mg [Capsella rubella]|uniref:Knottin scorpion toxin-like domain-containing protein n=1 Tax=Capsella rubella TaxID=81985 RepID=R0FMH9_9BRAS|nr:hypothetical protein CARUB_v10019561mg [Capsella rubella]